ncbi:MAG: response regulator [Candidatus Thermoplasmatota archaeon]
MKKTILIVDDDPDIRFTVKDALEGNYCEEFNVLEADGGRQCLQMLEMTPPDLILLDIMMPEMSGWEVYDELHKNPRWKKIPVVFLTARTDDLARNAGKILGKDYIEKPFEVHDLKQRIDMVLKKRMRLF